MEINKHGKTVNKSVLTETFVCAHCGCEFTANRDEYYVDEGSLFVNSAPTLSSTTHAYTFNTIRDILVCSCPECHMIVTKEKQRTYETPVITLSSSDVDSKIPDPCKSCSNHPSNGGAGNCNCTLGSEVTVTC